MNVVYQIFQTLVHLHINYAKKNGHFKNSNKKSSDKLHSFCEIQKMT